MMSPGVTRARGDGRHSRLLRALGRVDLLIFDDWGLEPLDAAARHDLLEILEDRYGHRSTIVTSQLPVDQWHALIGDPSFASEIPRSMARMIRKCSCTIARRLIRLLYVKATTTTTPHSHGKDLGAHGQSEPRHLKTRP